MNKLVRRIGLGTTITVLVAIIVGVWASPSAAQAVKAALTRNVDEPARHFVSIELGNGTYAYDPPLGKILVIEQIYANRSIGLTSTGDPSAANGTMDHEWGMNLNPPPGGPTVLQSVRLYVKGGRRLAVTPAMPSTFFQALGYLIDANP